MFYSPRVKEAMDTAIFCHLNQRDKGGYPYLAHPFHLAEQCQTESETVVALLHDAFEDSTGASQRYIRERLEECQATPEEWEAISLLSRNLKGKGLSYMDYIRQLASNPLARKIKILDLEHNLDTRRAPIPDSLQRRYERALRFLKEYEEVTE